ncbi:PQQ-dependent sugar dehydrogenase [Ideonella alba]|uniref:PQQ-dependent sugar dehydrogenase n=1 Tax=Ideonella alba TaxID=2824118 RepID=A0A940YF67_9BURK|nr:PQQ-dependent sugar dehydrogenase [Ideonella alba]MBQ0931422.1 PQQ-dependent sugar dehydrogenase [Ideonella alba]
MPIARPTPPLLSAASVLSGLVTLVLALAGAPAAAQRVPAFDAAQPPVPQQDAKAQQLREQLRRVRLPAGFQIELYALVPGARHLAVSPAGDRVFVGTRRDTVWAVTDRDGDRQADEVRALAPGQGFVSPNGVCLTPAGDLVVAERNRVLRLVGASRAGTDASLELVTVVPQGTLVPPEEARPNHGDRTCRVSDDGWLYITLGQPYNVQPREKVALYERLGIGGLVRLRAADGSAREVLARGVRASVGMDLQPGTGTVWFTDNQTDHMGDDIPPGELNRITRPGGEHFGYPFIHGRNTPVAGTAVAPDLKDLPPPATWTPPQAEFPAHQAQLGMHFYRGRQFPASFRGGIFVASHGSWNRSQATGALLNFVPLQPDGQAGAPTVFAEGWLDQGRYWGRPVDVAELPDGSLLVSDDHAGALYRIRYSAP